MYQKKSKTIIDTALELVSSFQILVLKLAKKNSINRKAKNIEFPGILSNKSVNKVVSVGVLAWYMLSY
jgi:hypothetical protein